MKRIPESIRSYISYNPETGAFTWTKKPNRRIKVGEPAGKEWDGGRRGKYIRIGFQGIKYYGHRVAWFLAHNEQADEIDHINNDSLDNRLCNLRNVDHRANMNNQARQKKHLNPA